MSMPFSIPGLPPVLPRPQAAAPFSFGSTSFSPIQQSFSFGAGSTNMTANVASPATVNTSMSEISATLSGTSTLSSTWSGFLSKERTISAMAQEASPASSSSKNDKFAASNAQNEPEKSKMIFLQQESVDNGRNRAGSEEKLSGGGGGGKGVFVAGKKSLKWKAVSDFEESEATDTRVRDDRPELSTRSSRFSDVCKDRITVD